MKRKIDIILLMLVLISIVAVQSCKKSPVAPNVDNNVGMPSVPVPSTGTIIAFTAASQAVNLSWATTATSGITYTVYFGTSSSPAMVASNVTTNSYTAHIGTKGGVYYWQVSSEDANGVTQDSPVWHFDVNSSPGATTLASPATAATGVSATATIKWRKTMDPEGDDLTYDLYLGTAAAPSIYAASISDTTYAITTALAYNTMYYWKVVTKDPYGGSSTSAVSSFTTGAFVPDFSVFNGIASEVSSSISSTAHNVYVQINTTAKTITLFLPLADAMVGAGWGTVYTGTHPIVISYNSTTYAVTSTKQLWADSFIDPTEMGPMSLQVATSGAASTIDAVNKKISIRWTVSGNAYWGADYTLSASTYTMK